MPNVLHVLHILLGLLTALASASPMNEMRRIDGGIKTDTISNCSNEQSGGSVAQITDHLSKLVQVLIDFQDRESDQDYKNPNFSCPMRNAGEFQLVGPPPYWSSCYYVSRPLHRVSFDSAEELCRSMGGHLVSVGSEVERFFLQRLYSIYPSGYQDYWIGAKFDDNGIARWTDSGDEVRFGKVELSSNFTESEFPQRECALNTKWGDLWKRTACSGINRFICEAPTHENMAKTLPVQEDININMSIVNGSGSFYIFVNEAYPWEKAQTFCQDQGGHLVIVDSLAENKILQRETGSHSRWMGAKRERDSSVWLRVDGQPLEGTFTDWPTLKSPETVSKPDCLLMSGHGNHEWDEDLCHNWRRFICEIPSNDSAELMPEEDEENQVCLQTNGVDDCYAFVQIQLQRENAAAHCQNQYSGRLARVNARRRVEFEKILKGFSSGNAETHWWLHFDETDDEIFTKNPSFDYRYNVSLPRSDYSLCERKLSEKDRTVICREHGFSTYDDPVQTSWSLYRENPVSWNPGFDCNGDETRVKYCSPAYDCHFRKFRAASIRSVPISCKNEPFQSRCPRVSVSPQKIRALESKCDEWSWFVCHLS